MLFLFSFKSGSAPLSSSRARPFYLCLPLRFSRSQSSSVVRLTKRVTITFLRGKGSRRSLPPWTRLHNWIHKTYLRGIATSDKACPLNCDGRGGGAVRNRTSDACLRTAKPKTVSDDRVLWVCGGIRRIRVTLEFERMPVSRSYG